MRPVQPQKIQCGQTSSKKFIVFWYAASCSLVEIKALMMEAVSTPETSVISRRPHGATSQKTVIFTLAAVRISNLTVVE
jgi:hypothetical protein